MKRSSVSIWTASLAAAGSGLVNLLSVIGPALPERSAVLRGIFPLDFVHVSRFGAMLIGFALIISSINLYKRKRRAYRVVSVFAALSIVFHLTKGLDYEEATVSAGLLALLLASRKHFTVQSSVPDLRWGFARLAVATCAALLYGTAGFWLLDRREFGINFHIGDAIHRTLLFLSFTGDPEIVPRTRYAFWFIDSLYVMSGVAIAYGLFAVFRPAIYRFRTVPHERALAETIVAEHGRSSLDYFKYWPDKSYYFPRDRLGFVAYRVGAGYALALADPVGPEEEIAALIRGFGEFCHRHDWRVAFHQTLPDFMPIYLRLGYRKLKIGDDAIVDLNTFTLDGKSFRKLRARNNKLESEGVRFVHWEPPIPDSVLAQAKEVSDEWLTIPGRRERTFSLGRWEEEYVRGTPLYAALDGNGGMLAFVNMVPSFCRGEATVDLMRHRIDAPGGMMDYLFTKLFSACKENGFTRFNMGMAPMAGFQDHEEASPEERAVHYFIQRMNFLFSYRGLRYFKAKFATSWEPRYLIYRNILNLPRVARAISEVSEFDD